MEKPTKWLPLYQWVQVLTELLLLTHLLVASGPIYVTNSGSNTISVIDGKTNKVVATIPVGASPHDIIGSMLGKLYVTNSGSNTISVIDGKTNKVVATIPVGSHPNSLYKTSDNRTIGGTIYTINTISNTISVIDGKTNKVVATIPVGASPHDIIGSMLGKLYVTNSGSNTISVIDGKTNKVVATIPVGASPHRVALCMSKTYVTNSGLKYYICNRWKNQQSGCHYPGQQFSAWYCSC